MEPKTKSVTTRVTVCCVGRNFDSQNAGKWLKYLTIPPNPSLIFMASNLQETEIAKNLKRRKNED
jgi:hypothetical protein